MTEDTRKLNEDGRPMLQFGDMSDEAQKNGFGLLKSLVPLV